MNCVAMVYYSRTAYQGFAMEFANPDPDEIRQLLNKVHRIAVVGLSPNPARPSFRVAQGLQSWLPYRPVRPRHGGAEPSGAGVAASHLLPQSAGYASNVSEVRPMVDGKCWANRLMKTWKACRLPSISWTCSARRSIFPPSWKAASGLAFPESLAAGWHDPRSSGATRKGSGHHGGDESLHVARRGHLGARAR